MIASHKQIYSTYWNWAEAQIEQAYSIGHIETNFGWRMAVDANTSRNTVLNFPQQAACAELLRLTVTLIVDRGMGPQLCATHHDAFYLECHDGEATAVSAALTECFETAATVVLNGRAQLRLDVASVHYPNHYVDEEGDELWQIVTNYLTNPRQGFLQGKAA